MILKNRDVSFKCCYELDVKVFKDWAGGLIASEVGAKYISNNNEIYPPLTSEEFVEMAHKFGYWQLETIPNELLIAMDNYRIRKEKELQEKNRAAGRQS